MIDPVEGGAAPLVVAAERDCVRRQAEAADGTAPRWDVAEVVQAVGGTLLSCDEAGPSRWRLAGEAVRRAAPGSLVVCFGEDVAVPLLLRGTLRRLRVLTIAHSLEPVKKLVLHRRCWGDRVAGLVVYSQRQEDLARHRLGHPAHRVHRWAFQADARFFTPPAQRRPGGPVVSVGGEHRDYPTLLAACTGLPVEASMGSQWARQMRGVASLPPGVVNRRRTWHELRALYQEAAVVAVPLLPCSFPAGISSILEAMACGAPVVVTRTAGLAGVLPDDAVVWVEPGGVTAMRAAIDALRADPLRAQAMGARARAWIEAEAGLDAYARRFAELVRRS